MTRQLLIAASVAVLALAACGKKEAPPAASTPAADAAAKPTQTADAGAAPAATPAPGQKINEGAPVDGDATVTAPKTIGAGAPLDVGWTGPGNKKDYIDIVPHGETKTDGEIGYAYTRDAIPVAHLRAPTVPGDYDVRYIFDSNDARKIKATAQVTVTAGAATLTAPAKAESGEPLQVQWNGPDGKGDYIDVVPTGYTDTSGEITYAYTSAGKPAQITAPGKAGGYILRYVLEGPSGRKVLATSALAVTTPTATLKAPDSAGKGSKIKVECTGPKRKGDYVDLVPKGYAETSGELTYFYTDPGDASELNAPDKAGAYEIRYVLEAPGQRVVLAKRSITVH